jgi:hypothetical protein
MHIRPLRHLLAFGALGVSLCAGTASAADYATITLNIAVDRPADAVWKKIGGYCDISAWLKMTCVYTSGSGNLGSVRRLNDRIDEVMVAKTLHSYTYTQPASTILYHGTLEVVAGLEEIENQLQLVLRPVADGRRRGQDKGPRTTNPGFYGSTRVDEEDRRGEVSRSGTGGCSGPLVGTDAGGRSH